MPLFFFRALRGTFAPLALASDKPMAIACLRLFTFFFERPERSVPRFISRMLLATFSLAALLERRERVFFADFLDEEREVFFLLAFDERDFFRVAMRRHEATYVPLTPRRDPLRSLR